MESYDSAGPPSTEPSRPPSVTPDSLQLHSPADDRVRMSSADAGQQSPPPLFSTQGGGSAMPSASVGVEGVRVNGRSVAVETVWSIELPPQPADFVVDVELSNGLTIVVPHQRRHVDGQWFVVAKDAIGEGSPRQQARQLIARFTRHDSSFSTVRLLLQVLGSPFATDGSSMLVLALATLVTISPAGEHAASRHADTDNFNPFASRRGGTGGGGAPSAEREALGLLAARAFDAALSDATLRYALLGALALAFLGRLCTRLAERFPPRSGYTLVIQPRVGRATHTRPAPIPQCPAGFSQCTRSVHRAPPLRALPTALPAHSVHTAHHR